MVILKRWFIHLINRHPWMSDPDFDWKQFWISALLLAAWLLFNAIFIYALFHSHNALADTASIPSGDDGVKQLTAAGTLLKILDIGIFQWGARIFAGLCIMSSAWSLKEQRFGVAVICIVGAILFGTAPKWVANLFAIGGNQGIFSGSTSSNSPKRHHYEV